MADRVMTVLVPVGYGWAGDIRKLRNLIELSVIAATGRELRARFGKLVSQSRSILMLSIIACVS